MKFHRLEFLSAPAEEGDDFRYKPHSMCVACGLRYVPFAADFPVPEDTVERVDLHFFESTEQPLLEVGGVLVAEQRLATRLLENGMTGFTIEEASASVPDENETRRPNYRWLRITGRCTTNDVWRRVATSCSICGTAVTEAVPSATRTVRLREPLPVCDLNRSRERLAGIIASERFLEVLDRVCPDHHSFLKLIGCPPE